MRLRSLIIGFIVLFLFTLSGVRSALAGGNTSNFTITGLRSMLCTSGSCGNITTVIVDGINLPSDARINVSGVSSGRVIDDTMHNSTGFPYITISGKTGNTQIIVDFNGLPCEELYNIAVISPLQSATYWSSNVFATNNNCYIKHPINWNTNKVSISASDFYIWVNNRKYYGNTADFVVRSDPGNARYTTLEATWHENGTEMRMNLYFWADNGLWTNYEMRTYDGQVNSSWLYFSGLKDKTFPFKPLGTALTLSPVAYFGPNPDDLRNTVQGTVNGNNSVFFENLRLLPFTSLAPSINSVNPSSATPGQWVELRGANFASSVSNNWVVINDKIISSPVSVSTDRTTLRFILPTNISYVSGTSYRIFVHATNGTTNTTSIQIVNPVGLELLTNAGFENGITGWGCGNGGSGGSCIIDSTVSRSGNKSIKVMMNNRWIGWGAQVTQGNISTNGTELMCLSYWVKKGLPTYTGVAGAIQETSSPWRAHELWRQVSSTNQWQNVRGTVLTGNDWSSKIQVYLRARSAGDVNWFDDVSLTRGACK